MQGKVLEPVLAALLEHDSFIGACPPKSSGREHYGSAFVDMFIELAGPGAALSDLLATAAAFTAHGIHQCVGDVFFLSFII